MGTYKNPVFAMLFVGAAVFAGLMSQSASIGAQTAKAAPRLANGKPDLTGIWDHPRVGDITANVDGPCAGGSRGCKQMGSGPLSFTPAGEGALDKNQTQTTFDYSAPCLRLGFVRSLGTPY